MLEATLCGKTHSQRGHPVMQKPDAQGLRDDAPRATCKPLPLSAFAGAPGSKVVCVELCAGCPRLSSALKTRGFAAVAVDHSKNLRRSSHSTICIAFANNESVA